MQENKENSPRIIKMLVQIDAKLLKSQTEGLIKLREYRIARVQLEFV